MLWQYKPAKSTVYLHQLQVSVHPWKFLNCLAQKTPNTKFHSNTAILLKVLKKYWKQNLNFGIRINGQIRIFLHKDYEVSLYIIAISQKIKWYSKYRLGT